jgi:hypothetical protein
MSEEEKKGSDAVLISPAQFFFVLALIAGLIYFRLHCDRHSPQEKVATPSKTSAEGSESLSPSTVATTSTTRSTKERPSVPALRKIRIATWNLFPLNYPKLDSSEKARVLIDQLVQFDVVAIQGVAVRNEAVLIDLARRMNEKTQVPYNYVCSPSVGRIDDYLAFLYNERTVQVDRDTVADVVDPLRRFHRPPLVAAFQTVEPDRTRAFTFTLINVDVSPENIATEQDLLADIYRRIRDDGRNEDDILMLGHFGGPIRGEGRLVQVPNLVALLENQPTTPDGTRPTTNFVYDQLATTEYIGRAKIVNLVKTWNLNLTEARSVANHLPVWMDFSVFEGGKSPLK